MTIRLQHQACLLGLACLLAFPGISTAEKKRMDQKNDLANDRIHSAADPMLLVDTTNLAHNNGTGLTVCEAEKHPRNPLVVPSEEGAVDDEACQLGSVIYHEGKFKMWYMSVNRENKRGCAYAESADGITWTKPILGKKSFKGSKKNNLIPLPPCHLPFIILDKEEDDPQKRFKMAVCTGSPKGGTGRAQLWTVAYSPDGLDWELQKQPLPPKKWEDGEAQMLARLGDGWVVHTQGFSKFGRTCMGFTSDSLQKPVSEWDKNILFTLADKYRAYQTHQGLSTWKRGGLTLGFTGIFCNRPELYDTSCDLAMVLSHDGMKWWEPWPLATIIRRGPQNSWDFSFIIQAYPGCINVGEKTYLYYTGGSEGNTIATKRIGLATLRRDGFGYMATRISWKNRGPGQKTSDFTTIPVRLQDKTENKVFVNADNLNEEQYLKIELLDKAGNAIPGYSAKEADPIHENGIAIPATWKGSSSLNQLPDDDFRLKVYLYGGRYRKDSPRVYAVYFNQPDEIEQ